MTDGQLTVVNLGAMIAVALFFTVLGLVFIARKLRRDRENRPF